MRTFASICLAWSLAAVSVSVCWPTTAAAATPQHSFSVEDMLNLENLGEARFIADGKQLVYVRVPKMQGRANQGLEINLRRRAGEIRIIDVAAASTSRPLFPQAQDTSYWFGGSSPNGGRLLVYAVKGPTLRLGVYDFVTSEIVWFAATPAYGERMDFSPVWISEDQVAYPSHIDGRQPYDAVGRPYMAQLLHQAWERTWRGEQPSVEIAESRADGGGNAPLSGQLVVADVKSGSLRVLAEGLFSDLRVSSDLTHLAALRAFTLPQPAVGRLLVDWFPSSRSQLQVISLVSGESRIVAGELAIGPGTLEWSTTRDSLAFFAWPESGPMQTGLLYVYSASAQTLAAWPHRGLDLVSERERGYLPRPERIAWFGDRLAIPARRLADATASPRFSVQGIVGRDSADPGRVDWYALDRDGSSQVLTKEFDRVAAQVVGTDSRGIAVLAAGHVWRIDVDRKRQDLTPGITGTLRPAVTRGSDRSPLSDVAAFAVGNEGYVVVDVTGRKRTTVLERAPADSALLAVSSGTATLALRDDHDQGVDVLVHRVGGPSRVLERLNPQLAQIAPSAWKVIEYSIKNGPKLDACLLTPPGYQSGRRYPVIVNIYPGTRASCASPEHGATYRKGLTRDIGFNFDELLAGHGYLVFKVAAPSELIRTPEGPIEGMPSVVEQGIDALIEQGYADPDRIGLFGMSQGGISSLWLATRMSRFKAIVSMSGWADLAGHYFDSGYREMLMPESMPYATVTVGRYENIAGSDLGLGKTFWEAPDLYFRNSPLYRADRIHSPLMLIHTDMDVFPMEQYDAMFSALYRLRRPATYLRYLGEGHSPSSAANVRDMWHRIFDWYRTYMGSNGSESVGH